MVFMSKRAFFPAFFGLLLFTLIACGGGEQSSEQAEAESATNPVSTETRDPAAETPTATPDATGSELFLQLVEPAETEVFTNVAAMVVTGRTRIDAMVTINDTVVEPNIDGEFSLDMDLEEGPNIIEIVSSVASGQQMDLVLVAIYVP